MRDAPADRLRLTVLGCSTAAPHPATPTAGFLVEWGTTASARPRAGRRPRPPAGPRSARPGGDRHRPHARRPLPRPRRPALPVPVGRAGARPAAVPPAARRSGPARRPGEGRLSERAGFFDAASSPRSTTRTAVEVGPLRRALRPRSPLRPAWGVVVEAPDGARLGYTGDTGPSESVVEAMRGVDLLLVEAALGTFARRPGARPPDGRGGHRAGDGRRRAIDAPGPLRAGRRAELEALASAAPGRIAAALDGLTVTVGTPAVARDAQRRPS